LVFAAVRRAKKMKISEDAVFKWVVIVVVAAVSIVALTLLTRPLVGALWALLLVCVAVWYGFRWVAEKWRGR